MISQTNATEADPVVDHVVLSYGSKYVSQQFAYFHKISNASFVSYPARKSDENSQTSRYIVTDKASSIGMAFVLPMIHSNMQRSWSELLNFLTRTADYHRQLDVVGVPLCSLENG